MHAVISRRFEGDNETILFTGSHEECHAYIVDNYDDIFKPFLIDICDYDGGELGRLHSFVW